MTVSTVPVNRMSQKSIGNVALPPMIRISAIFSEVPPAAVSGKGGSHTHSRIVVALGTELHVTTPG